MRKHSLLSHKPDWRFRLARSREAEDNPPDDPLIQRYLKARTNGFRHDDELFAVLDMDAEDRGLIEALYLGGANISQICMYTKTTPEVVNLVLDFFFDVSGVIDSPLLRSQLAAKETNRVVKSYKTFTAKYGWKKFIEQFLSRDEALASPPTVPEAQTDLLIELRKKITELGIYDTGSQQSKELLNWMKLFLDLTREIRAHDWVTEQEKDTDIGRLMSYLRDNDVLCTSKQTFEFRPIGLDNEEIQKDEKSGD